MRNSRKAGASSFQGATQFFSPVEDDALDLPVDSASVDYVISNGVLNLTPDKTRAYSEAFRVLKPGGAFLYADIGVADELSESTRRDIDLWTG